MFPATMPWPMTLSPMNEAIGCENHAEKPSLLAFRDAILSRWFHECSSLINLFCLSFLHHSAWTLCILTGVPPTHHKVGGIWIREHCPSPGFAGVKRGGSSWELCRCCCSLAWFCHWFLGGGTDSSVSVAESYKHCFLDGKDGKEATVGIRDAC